MLSHSQRVRRRPEIVLVGDDDAFLHGLAELLEDSGYPMRMAVSAPLALVEIDRGGVDVVLCDLGASQMQSVEVALALRTRGERGAPPVVAISSMPNIAQHCQTLGVRHFLAQPFRLRELTDILDALGAATSARSGAHLAAATAASPRLAAGC